MKEILEVPSQCRECPVVGELRKRFTALYVDPEAALTQIERVVQGLDDVIEEQEISIDQERMDDARSDVYRSLAERLDNNEADQIQHERMAASLTAACKGLITLSGADHAGYEIRADVCGSSFWTGASTEQAHVTRRDRTAE